MAQVLFVSPADVIKRTGINGNVDRDQMIQFIKIAQDIHIQNILGTKLFNKIASDIDGDTLTGNYLTLFTDYIQDMVIHWATIEILPYIHYKVANGGIYTKSAENGTTISKQDLDYLVQKERDIAEHYSRRFVDHMAFYSSRYPEYNTSSNDDMYPSKNQNFNGWVL
tara:strand:+ start:336 stop:836 length:501 start_codon:yes stop_codon:yes gene_type:complete